MTDVVMPQMGESIVEGTLTKWLKKPGDRVERDEPLFEISTDKVDTEIPAPAAGVLREVLVDEGKTVAISTVVGRIDEAGDGAGASAAPSAAAEPPGPASYDQRQPPRDADVGPSTAAHTPEPGHPARPEPAAAGPYPIPQPQAPPTPSPEPESPLGPLSPLVRKMAREYGIDLKQVRGTGAGGRITRQDLEAYMSAQGARTMQQSGAVAPTPQPSGAGPYPIPQAAPPQPQAAPPQQPAFAPPPPQQQAPAAPAMPRAEQPRTRIEPMSTMRQK